MSLAKGGTIEALKQNWRLDPCWDLETTEGYEEFRQDLYIYRLEQEKAWLEQRVHLAESKIWALREALKPFVEATHV